MPVAIAEFVRRHNLNLRDSYYRTLVVERMRENAGEQSPECRIERYCGPNTNAETYRYVRSKLRNFGFHLREMLAVNSANTVLSGPDAIVHHVQALSVAIRHSSLLYRGASNSIIESLANHGIDLCKCDDCCEIVEGGECVTLDDGERICESCQDDYCSCDSCSELVRQDDCQEIDGDGNYCRRCVERDAYWWESDESYHFEPEPEEEPEFEPETQGNTFRGHPIRIRLDELVRESAGIIASELPNNGIAEEGMTRIGEHLRDYAGVDALSVGAVEVELRNEQHQRGAELIEWVTKLGTLPKRIGRILSKRHVKLSPEHAQQIGNIARDYCPKLTKIRWKLIHSHQITWDKYGYGQAGSCWWPGGCYGNCRDQWMCQPNAYVLCVYDELGRGIGRIFGAILADQTNDEVVAFVVFNPYGPHSNLTHARLLATHLGWHYSQTGLDAPDFFINPPKPIMLCPEVIEGEGRSFDMCWDVPKPKN